MSLCECVSECVSEFVWMWARLCNTVLVWGQRVALGVGSGLSPWDSTSFFFGYICQINFYKLLGFFCLWFLWLCGNSGIADAHFISSFYMNSGDLNLGPYSCVASTLSFAHHLPSLVHIVSLLPVSFPFGLEMWIYRKGGELNGSAT